MALVAAGILSAIPGLGSYPPTGLWGAADQLAVGTVPDPLLIPVVVNTMVIAVALALAGLSFSRREL